MLGKPKQYEIAPEVAEIDRTDPLARGLLAWWRFKENAGIKATDSSGYNNHGQLINGVAETQGKFGKAITLTSASIQYVYVPPPNWVLSRATITQWIYPTSNNANQGYRGLFYSRLSAGAPGFGLGYGSPSVSMQLGYQWSGAEWQWNSGLILPFNQWVFVAFVVTPSGGTMYMGNNGQLQSATFTTTEATATFSSEIDIGYDSFQTTRIFDGKMDDIRVYNRALSPQEMRALFEQPMRPLVSPRSWITNKLGGGGGGSIAGNTKQFLMLMGIGT